MFCRSLRDGVHWRTPHGKFLDIWSLLDTCHLWKCPGFRLRGENGAALPTASIHKAFAVTNSQAFTFSAFELCPFGSRSVPRLNTRLAESQQHRPCCRLHTAPQRQPPLCLQLPSQEGLPLSCPQNHPSCCELMLRLAFYGCWWTRNSSEKDDGRRHRSPVPPAEGMLVVDAGVPWKGTRKPRRSQPVPSPPWWPFFSSLGRLMPGHSSFRNYWGGAKRKGKCCRSLASELWVSLRVPHP